MLSFLRKQNNVQYYLISYHGNLLKCMVNVGEGMATHSSVHAWRIPGTEEPGGLPSMRSHRVRHDSSDLAAVACMVNVERS